MSHLQTGRSRARVLPATAAIAVVLGVSACSGSGTSTPSASPDAKATLSEAKAHTDAASSIHVALTSRDIPDNVAGMFSADGVGTHAPAFKGKVNARFRGLSGDVEVVAVNGGVWLKVPFAPTFVKADVATLGIPDPATLLTADRGLTTLLTDTRDPAFGDQVRSGSDVLTTIKGTLPGDKIVSLLAAGDPNGSYDVTYGLTDTKEIRTVTITGPFFPPSRSTYEITLDRYGESVAITEP